MKKNRMNRITGLVLALVLIIGNLGQVRDPTVVYAEKLEQTEQDTNSGADPSVEGSSKDTTETPVEDREVAQDAETGEKGSEVVPDIDTNGTGSNQADTDSVDVDQADEAEALVETEGEIMPLVMTFVGYNLYTGDTLEDVNYIGTYTTWSDLVAAINVKGVGTYAIDLYDMDLTPPKNWESDFTSGTEQYYLNFYSSTYEATGRGMIKLVEESVMGAHLQFHSGVGLNTPISSGAGSIPFSSSSIASYHSVNDYRSGAIYANGWRFIVDKGVKVTGGPAILYAGRYMTNFQFDSGKTILTDEEKAAEGIQTSQDILTGYIEVNSGNWRLLSGYIRNGFGAYRIKVGTNDDPNNPVRIDAAIGKTTSVDSFYPLTPSPDIPSEYIEINGNTIVNYGVAMMTAGNTEYKLNTKGTDLYATQKVKISGNVSILSTFGGVTPSMLQTLSSA